MTLGKIKSYRWKKIHLFDSVASTNKTAEDLIGTGSVSGVVISEQQTDGRGRMGKSWHSPAGKNIYLTLFGPMEEGWKPIHIAQHAALSVYNLVSSVLPHCHPLLKWPNDILLNKKKVAGILGKIVEHNQTVFYLSGFGLNVENPGQSNFSYTWTPGSLEENSEHRFTKSEIAEKLLEEADTLLSLPPAEISSLFLSKIMWMTEKKVYCSIDTEHFFMATIISFSPEGDSVTLIDENSGKHITTHSLSIRKIFW